MIAAIILFVILASLTVIGYVLNSKTPKPDGCQNLEGMCEGCSITSCIQNPKLKEEIKND